LIVFNEPENIQPPGLLGAPSEPSYSIFTLKCTLRWLVFGSSTYAGVCPRRLNPRRIDSIFDLEMELIGVVYKAG